jgi:CysZ protein
MWGFFRALGAGATYPLRAIAQFRRTPRLLGYVAIPLMLNILIGIGLYLGLLRPGWAWINQVMGEFALAWQGWIANLPTWLGFLGALAIGFSWAAKGLLILGLLLLVGFLLAQFGALLGSPWYGQLSEQLERLQRGQVEMVPVGLVRELGRAIVFELKKLLLLVTFGFGFFLLNFFPGLGSVVASVGSITLATALICLDFLDPPLERRRLGFRQKLGFIFGALPGSASFGLVCLGLVSIPLINLFTVPICIAAGTLFYCDLVTTKTP